MIIRRRAATTAACTALGMGLWLVGPAPTAHACHEVPVCVEWGVLPTDLQSGDYLTQVVVPARGVRIRVLRPPPEPPLSMFLDDQGCGSFKTQFSSGHTIIVHAEALLGPTQNIHIKVFQDPGHANENLDIGNWWAYHVPPIGENQQVEIYVPPDDAFVTTQIATASEVVHRLTSLSGSLLTNPLALEIVRVRRLGANLCEGNRICLGLASRDEKFVLGHEMGHWIHLHLTNDPWLFGDTYDYAAQDDDCLSTLDPDELAEHNIMDIMDANVHAIRTAEHSLGSMTEGFAHFVSAAAFNDIAQGTEGVFKYYKALDGQAHNGAYATFVDPAGDDYEVSLAGGSATSTLGGRSQWAELECPTDFAFAGGEVTSEIDWLRFYWQFLTEDTAALDPAPTFWDVVNLVTYSQTEKGWPTNGDIWNRLVDAVDDAAFGAYEARFLALEPGNGVFDEP